MTCRQAGQQKQRIMSNLKNIIMKLPKQLPRDLPSPHEKTFKYEQLLNEQIMGIDLSKNIGKNRNVTDEEIALENMSHVKGSSRTNGSDGNPFENSLSDSDDDILVYNSEDINHDDIIIDEADDYQDSDDDRNIIIRVSMFSSKVKEEMKQVMKSFVLIYSLMIGLIILIGSIYYGTITRKQHYLLQNLSIEVVNQDYQLNNVFKPYIGNLLEFITRNNEDINSKVVINYNVMPDIENTDDSNKTLQYIQNQLTHHKTWGIVYLPRNSTINYRYSLKDPNVSFEPTIQFLYQSTRNPNLIHSYVVPIFGKIEHLYQLQYSEKINFEIYQNWLNDDERKNIIDNLQISKRLFKPMNFIYNDINPFRTQILNAPLTIGLVMLIIVSFFQFHFFMPIHNLINEKIKPNHYIYYRMITSQITYIFLSLGFSSLFYIFYKHMDHFIEFWMLTYLTISSVGGMNENMALMLFILYSPLVGFWLLFWVILNISPTLNPIESLPKFYKYGYALPIFNYKMAILKIFSPQNNIHMHGLWENILVLCSWVLLNNLIFPFTLNFFSYKMLVIENLKNRK